jgi:mannose-1-phosphate guanylyltransferase
VKALILVGGEGTRLRPLTCNTPKAMVPILNQPFLEHLLCYLKKHGISEAILAMGFLPDPIQSRLGDGSHFGIQISYLVEESPLGTAGAVKNAESFLDEPFIVFNGDVLTEIDLTDMIKQHREINPEVTIALTPVDNPTIYGVVETTAAGMVKRFVEKPTWDKVTTNMINAGIYILEPGVLEYIPTSAPCMFEDYVFPTLLKIGKSILSYPSDAYWIDIGTPEKYLRAHHDLLLRWGDRAICTQGESQIHTTAQIEGPALIGEECLIAENVQIKGPTVLGPRCQIGASVVMEGVVLWEGTQVGEQTVLRNCVIGSCTHIGSSCQILDDCVLGDDVTVDKESNLASGTRLWPNNYVDPSTLQST